MFFFQVVLPHGHEHVLTAFWAWNTICLNQGGQLINWFTEVEWKEELKPFTQEFLFHSTEKPQCKKIEKSYFCYSPQTALLMWGLWLIQKRTASFIILYKSYHHFLGNLCLLKGIWNGIWTCSLDLLKCVDKMLKILPLSYWKCQIRYKINFQYISSCR